MIRLMIFWKRFHDIASIDPIMNPMTVLPNSLTEASSNNDSAIMAIMGPKMMALGDIVFISAQINPAGILLMWLALIIIAAHLDGS